MARARSSSAVHRIPAESLSVFWIACVILNGYFVFGCKVTKNRSQYKKLCYKNMGRPMRWPSESPSAISPYSDTRRRWTSKFTEFAYQFHWIWSPNSVKLFFKYSEFVFVIQWNYKKKYTEFTFNVPGSVRRSRRSSDRFSCLSGPSYAPVNLPTNRITPDEASRMT